MPPEAAIPVVPGIDFRETAPGDEPFLRALYRSTREPELDLTGWEEAQKQAFADSQFALQDHHYREHYRGAAFLVIERAGEPIGRLYLYAMPNEVRVMDVALIDAARNRGLGTAIMEAVLADAARDGAAVTLHVESFNRARTLYDRLGFREEAVDGVHVRMRRDPPA